MLKREIQYEDFDENKITETFYFNLSKTELMELDVTYEGGFQNYLTRTMESKDEKSIWDIIKTFILISYGEKSDDGKRFRKKDDDGKPLKYQFENSAAYDALFMDLLSDDKKALAFINGMMPREIAEAAEQEMLKQQMAEKMSKAETVPSEPIEATEVVETPPMTTAEIAAQQAQQPEQG